VYVPRQVDDDKGRNYELEQSAVKCMRGILFCYMRQAPKVRENKQCTLDYVLFSQS
jgi:phosphorylase kinase alpha/beta subunit